MFLLNVFTTAVLIIGGAKYCMVVVLMRTFSTATCKFEYFLFLF